MTASQKGTYASPEPVTQGTFLLTNWGPAVAGRTWHDDPNQEVVYLKGAAGSYGQDLEGTTGAFPIGTVRGWVVAEQVRS